MNTIDKSDLFHFDYAGEPYCGAEPEGAYVVEMEHVTCEECLEAMQKADQVMDENVRRLH